MNTVFCGKSEKINGFSSHKHCKYWEIILCLSGSCSLILDNTVYKTEKNHICLIPPETVHKGVCRDSYANIVLQAENIDFTDITIVYDYDKNVRSLFEMLYKTMLEKEKNYADIADSLTNTICLYIKKYCQNDYKYDFTIKFKNLLYDNISNTKFNITNEICKLGYHADYFRRCFKEEFGKTPLEYLTSLRISTAKRMLIQKNFQSIETTAYKCGFNDSFYFSKIFKRATGLSPRDFRKNYHS